MESTSPAVVPATVSVEDYPSLFVAFQSVPDPRRTASVTYPLAALLALAVAAILANHTSILAIAEWGQRQAADVLAQLGLPDGRSPWQSTLQRVFAQLDGRQLATVLTAHFAPLAASDPAQAEPRGVAIDGKAQRGRLVFDPAGGTVHALSALCHETGLVLAQEPIRTTGDKIEAELTVAPDLIDRLNWHNRVLTGDALFCQRALIQQIAAAGGDYLLLVRGNQPALHDAIQRLFDPAPGDHPLPLRDRRVTQTIDRGHGRGVEVRQLIATTDLTAYLTTEFAWPAIAQVFRLERTWSDHAESKRQIRYGITSLAPDGGPPERLLALKRGHWQIENGLHRTKDVTFGEDQSLIHCGQGPTVMALLRDTALNLLHLHGIRHITACLRTFSQFPDRAIALVLNPAHAHA
jgi:predicted transposase YbfD/YdcC